MRTENRSLERGLGQRSAPPPSLRAPETSARHVWARAARSGGLPAGFLDHVERTAERLEAWRVRLDEHDRLLLGDADVAPDQVASAHAPAFFCFLDASHAELEAVTRHLDAEQQHAAGAHLRTRLAPWLMRSRFLARTIERPRGYAGDAEMMRMVYERRFEGRTTFDKLMHRHPVESAAAQAVRNRRELIPRLLREVDQGVGALGDRLAVLSVACGPAWELRDLYRGAADATRFRCTLLDQDAEALDTARSGLAELERAFGRELPATFVEESVKTLLRSAATRASLGRFHFVYSMGLYDYLPEPVARRLTHLLFEMIEPHGTLVIGNYHVANPTRTYMQYWMNWPLEYRTEEQLLSLAPTGAGARSSLSFDGTRSQMFLRVERV
jgi:extracellular factor (EF) 3-hydroxypalmitic acid methyl ester biosynthesis protein